MTRQDEIQHELGQYGLRMEHSLSAFDGEGHAVVDLSTGDSVDPPNDHVRELAVEWSALESPTLTVES